MKNYVKSCLIVLAGAVLSCLLICRIDAVAVSPGHYLAALESSSGQAGRNLSGAGSSDGASSDAGFLNAGASDAGSLDGASPGAGGSSDGASSGEGSSDAAGQASVESSAEWIDSIRSDQEREEQVRDLLIQYCRKQKFAQEDTSEFTYNEYEDYVVVTGYTGTGTTVTIPPVINGKAVTSVGSGAFTGNLYLEEAILPDTVMEVGSSAFSDCKSLRAVTLGSGTINIQNGAFSGCENLKTVTKSVNEQINLPLRNIDTAAFRYCGALETIDLSYVVKVNSYAFAECSALAGVSLERVVTIWDNSFRGCALLESVSFPATLEHLGDSSFRECPLLHDITFEEGGSAPLKIGESVFEDSSVEELVLPGRCEEIGYGAFIGCGSLKRFTLQSSGKNTATQNLSHFVFSRDEQLTAVYLPITVEWISNDLGLSNPDVVLYAPEGSYAKQYAEENNISWAPWE